MSAFQTLRLSDQTKINRILKDSFYGEHYSSSELVYENMFVWNYHNQIEISWLSKGLAIVRSLEKDHRWIYFPPICRTPEEFQNGLVFIKNNYPDAIVGGLSIAMIDHARLDRALYLYDDYFSEYIYDPIELAEMKGGKFSRKRNLVAQFKKKYNYSFIPYDNRLFDAVKAFLDRYKQEGGAADDFEAIYYALENRNKINLFCDLLLVDDLVVGLSIGTISLFNHAVILFEKNDFDYVGSGATLVQLATNAHYRGCRVLTRQEDLGLPQLRKAKLSLNPIEKERKYCCLFNQRTMQLHDLYLTSFDDSSDYVDFFFLHYYRPDRAFSAERDQAIRSALHIIMKRMVFNQRTVDLPFIVAAATQVDYRRRGLMREVMAKTFTALIDEGYAIVSLYPANPDFYRDYGFVPYTYAKNLGLYENSFECGLEETSDAALLSSMYLECISDYEGYVIRDEEYYTRYMNSLWQDGYVFELIKKEGQIVGYLARKDHDIDEILIHGNEKPAHKNLDTKDVYLPHPDGEEPSNMIRIINAVRFLEMMSFADGVSISIRLKITDRFVLSNNVTMRLTVRQTKIIIEPCDEYDAELSVEDLTLASFVGRGDPRLSFLFPSRKMVCFDKF
ncbi:MAG: GNAT family N-acetyltransferase [Bacilli bacterium]|jgi:GNAT superfamily N-acetyltransferase